MTPSHSNNVTATGQLDLSGLPNKKARLLTVPLLSSPAGSVSPLPGVKFVMSMISQM